MFWFKKIFATIIAVGLVVLISSVLLPSLLESTYTAPISVQEQSQVASVQTILVNHLTTPEPLKAIHMTACVAGTLSWREDLKKLIRTTELNAVVIDIKDYTGVVSFPLFHQGFEDQISASAQKGCVVSDMREFVRQLHDAGIYVIGRISVFQDPSYAKLFPELAVKNKNDGKIWTDYKGLSFIDAGAKPYWNYIVELSEKAYELGFDEINYDYVRYPSDGNMQNALYTWSISTSTNGLSQTKSAMLENFFQYLHDNLENTGAKLSVDLFGMTTTVEHDMNIGQVLELALPYFDYVSPMVYPSHYPSTWNGFTNPAEHPYEVVKIALTRGLERERAWNISNGFFSIDSNGATTTPVSKLRPWLQDFNLGATYGPDKIRAQIQATYDAGLTSWMLWNAGNKYTAAALLLE